MQMESVRTVGTIAIGAPRMTSSNTQGGEKLEVQKHCPCFSLGNDHSAA